MLEVCIDTIFIFVVFRITCNFAKPIDGVNLEVITYSGQKTIISSGYILSDSWTHSRGFKRGYEPDLSALDCSVKYEFSGLTFDCSGTPRTGDLFVNDAVLCGWTYVGGYVCNIFHFQFMRDDELESSSNYRYIHVCNVDHNYWTASSIVILLLSMVIFCYAERIEFLQCLVCMQLYCGRKERSSWELDMGRSMTQIDEI